MIISTQRWPAETVCKYCIVARVINGETLENVKASMGGGTHFNRLESTEVRTAQRVGLEVSGPGELAQGEGESAQGEGELGWGEGGGAAGRAGDSSCASSPELGAMMR